MCYQLREQQIGRRRVRTYCISTKTDLCIKERTASDANFRPCSITDSCCPGILPLHQKTLIWSIVTTRKSEIYSTSDRSSHCGQASFTVPSTDLFVILDMNLDIDFILIHL